MNAMADQPQVSALVPEVIKLVSMSLGLAYFIYLILSDVCTALRGQQRARWIPGNALVLSALTIQVLTYLDYKNISISDNPNPKDIAKLLGNQVVIDSGRVVICVFIGYLLPGMAARGSAQASADIVALLVSLFAAITSEVYYVRKAGNILNNKKIVYGYEYEFLNNYRQQPSIKLWFLVSSYVFLVAIIWLTLFLVSAILAGKTVRCMLKQRINSAIQLNKSNECEGEECWNKFEDEVFRSWLLCRVGQPEYVIARSVLISSTGLVVTICILLLVAKAFNLMSVDFLHFYDELDWLRHTTFVLQCLFLTLGGFVIFYRWLMAVVYFPKFFGKGRYCRFSVEDFWARSVLELIDMFDIQRWRRLKKPSSDSKYSRLSIRVLTKMQLHKLLYFFWAAQMLLVWFSKGCWLFSEMVFGCMFIRRCVVGNDKVLLYEVDPSDAYHEFKKYRETLEHVCMPGENPASLWLSNEDSTARAKNRLQNGHENGDSGCKDLISLINGRQQLDGKRFVDQLKSLPLVQEYFPTLNENYWKMTAISLLKIMIQLPHFHKEEDSREKTADGSQHPRTGIEGYQQAWDLMTFVESSNSEQPNSIDVTRVFDIEADQVSMVADKELKKLLELAKKMLDSFQNTTAGGDVTGVSEDGGVAAVGKVIRSELEIAERNLKAEKLLQENGEDKEKADTQICEELKDSKDWNMIAANYSMYRVCNAVLASNNRESIITPKTLHGWLGDVIAHCLEQLPDMVLRSCREWAVDYEEDKIWEVIYIAGKAKEVIHEKCKLKAKWKATQQKEMAEPVPTEAPPAAQMQT